MFLGLPLLAYSAAAFLTLSAFPDEVASRNAIIVGIIFSLIAFLEFLDNKKDRDLEMSTSKLNL